ncbi:MAG: hypothetical protein QOF76_4412 [Solirubrobacteraceae bacterium]|jgi:hypothetical protein|nr:hypothetical protein [Solirubrobacteraceae bacterium]
MRPQLQTAPRPAVDAASYAGAVIADAHDLRILRIFQHHGYDSNNWQGKHLSFALPPEAMDLIVPRWAAAAGGEPQSFEYESLDGDATHWVQLTPIRDANDASVTEILMIVQDVTARHSAGRTRAGRLGLASSSAIAQSR